MLSAKGRHRYRDAVFDVRKRSSQCTSSMYLRIRLSVAARGAADLDRVGPVGRCLLRVRSSSQEKLHLHVGRNGTQQRHGKLKSTPVNARKSQLSDETPIGGLPLHSQHRVRPPWWLRSAESSRSATLCLRRRPIEMVAEEWTTKARQEIHTGTYGEHGRMQS